MWIRKSKIHNHQLQYKLIINTLYRILWQFFIFLHIATNLPQSLGVFLKIIAVAINKKILQIIDFAGFKYFLMLFENFRFR
ncbi:hypothetical protein EGI16_08990 [Chryseobacterium sp. G0240]|nr:hypothetical protein EGI16_08990 [Chryseobacterium sp. G0240]